MRLKIKDLRKILKETKQKKMISEAFIRLSDSSVDDQIDSLIIGFEKDSSTKEEEVQTAYEGVNRNDLKILFEAEEDEEQDEENVGTSKDMDTSRPSLPDIPPININKFASKVARLITNRDNLLDVKTVIYNRSCNFIKQNYGKQVAKMLQDALEQEHGIEQEKEYHEKFPVNYAAGAFPSGG